MIELCQDFRSIDPEVRDALLKKYLTSLIKMTWVYFFKLRLKFDFNFKDKKRREEFEYLIYTGEERFRDQLLWNQKRSR